MPAVVTLFSSVTVDENSLTFVSNQSVALKWSCKIIIIFMFLPGFLTAKLNLLGYYLHRSIVYMKMHICEQVWVVCLSVSGSTVHQESKKVSLITIHWTVWGDRGTQNTETSA